MGKFIAKVDKLGYIDGINWKVESNIVFRSNVLGCDVTVPTGRITDLASTPRLLWGAYPPTVYANEASVHDELYTLQKCTREQADKVFLEALECEGVYSVRRYGFYWALRMFGWIAWNAHKKARVLHEPSLPRA